MDVIDKHTQKFLTTKNVSELIEQIMNELKSKRHRRLALFYASSLSTLCFVCLDEDVNVSISEKLNTFVDRMTENIEKGTLWQVKNDIHTSLLEAEKYEILSVLKKKNVI